MNPDTLMNSESIYTVLITAITVLGSARAWRYYEKKAQIKQRAEDYMKDDCKERIIKLEKFLEESSEEKDEMRNEILKLTSEVSELRVKVEYLEDENKALLRTIRKIKNTGK